MKRFGFGAMRLPMLDGEVDKAQFCAMIDEFIAAGFTYFRHRPRLPRRQERACHPRLPLRTLSA
ncbi:MAG: hypothetical protein ACLTSG_07160 [Lachnospiraceae bacterium]